MGRRAPGGPDRRTSTPNSTDDVPSRPATTKAPYAPRAVDDALAEAVLDPQRHFVAVVGEPLAGTSRTLGHAVGQLRRSPGDPSADVRRVPGPRFSTSGRGPSLAAAVVAARKLGAPVTLVVDDLDSHVGRGLERPLIDGLAGSDIRLLGTIRSSQLELLHTSFPEVADLVDDHRAGPTVGSRLSPAELQQLPDPYRELRPSARSTLARSLSGAESVLRHLAEGAEREPLGVLVAELAALWGAIGLPEHAPTPALVRMARATAPLRGLAPPTNDAMRAALTWATRVLEAPLPSVSGPRLLEPAPWGDRQLRPHPVLRAEATSLRATEIAAALPVLLAATDTPAAPRVAAALLHGRAADGGGTRTAAVPLLRDRLGDVDVVSGVQQILSRPDRAG